MTIVPNNVFEASPSPDKSSELRPDQTGDFPQLSPKKQEHKSPELPKDTQIEPSLSDKEVESSRALQSEHSRVQMKSFSAAQTPCFAETPNTTDQFKGYQITCDQINIPADLEINNEY